MRLTKPLGRRNGDDRAELEERTALLDGAARSTAPRCTAPARVSTGVPGLASRQTTRGPTRPEVQGTSRKPKPATGKAMTPGRAHATARQVHGAMAQLHPVAHPATGLPGTPQTLRAMGSEAGFREGVSRLFGDGPAARAVADQLLAAVPPDAASADAAYIAPLVLATALKAIDAHPDHEIAPLLAAAAQGGHSPTLFRLERALAQSGPGMTALGQLRQLTDQPDRLAALRDGLNLCTVLERKGLPMDAHASIADVVAALEDRRDLHLDRAVGRADDAPLQLLAQALLHTHRLMAAAPANGLPHQPAYVAWKKGGFTESGAGTDFNRTIERLHKFGTYIDRADHGPRTVRNLLREAASVALRTVGVGKSPLTPMRLGTQGGDLGRLHEEAAKYRAALDQALTTAVQHLRDALRDPELRSDPAARTATLARAAAFGLWRDSEGATLPVATVVDRARQLHRESGGADADFDERSVHRELDRIGKRSTTDDGASALRMSLSTLEAVGTGRRHRHGAEQGAPFNPLHLDAQIAQLRNVAHRTSEQAQQLQRLQGERRQHIAALLKEMRAIERGGDKPIPLFKWSDLKVLLRRTPRPGPTPETARRVMTALASARYESMATFADGTSRGAGTFGAILMNAGSTLGIPLAYPVLRAEVGKRAQVTVGVSNTGGRFVVGTERAGSASAGAGGGWAFPTWVKRISAGAVGELSGHYARSAGGGAAITTRNDVEGWHDKLPQVIDFFFDEARRPAQGGPEGRAADASDLWCRFADRFGADPHVAVGWIRESSSGVGVQASATAFARGVVDANTNIGPALTAGVGFSAGSFARTPAANGTDVPVAVRNRRTIVAASAALTETAPAAKTDDPTVTGWGAAVPLVGASMEWNIAGGLGVARLGRARDGRLSPGLCHREFIFQRPERLIAFANLHRATWEAAMVAKDPARATTPDVARERLNRFLQQVADAPARADRLYGEQLTLHPDVATRINHFEARLNAILGSGDRRASERELSADERAECNALQNEAQRLLDADESWEHAGIYAVEINQSGGTTGLNFGLRSVNVEQARAARLTSLLIAGVPEE